MTDAKHFRYDGHAQLKVKSPAEVAVKEVAFLTPARLTLIIDGEERTVGAHVDILNRKVYCDDPFMPDLSEAVFGHLDGINTLPEDFFAMPEDVAAAAAQAQGERDTIKKIGDQYGRADFN